MNDAAVHNLLDPEALAQACAAQMWQVDAASRALGMVLGEVRPGQASLMMAVTERMVNGHGICHGGMIFTLADSALGFASSTRGEVCLAQHCAITYLRPARLGEMLRADAVERVRDGRSGLYDVRVTARDGVTIAEYRGYVRTTGERLLAGSAP